MSQNFVQECFLCDRQGILRHQTYVIISNWRSSWIHRIGFRDSQRLRKSHPIDQKVVKTNKKKSKII